jgi:hypothetical protein
VWLNWPGWQPRLSRASKVSRSTRSRCGKPSCFLERGAHRLMYQ